MPHRLRAVLAPASALLLTLLVTLVLGACSGDPKPKFAPSPSASPSVSVTSTPSPTAPVAPTLPAEARDLSPAGAKAFVVHFWDVANYAQATGDTEAFEALVSDRCAGCQGALEAIRDVHTAGGSIEGGEGTVSNMRAEELFAPVGAIIRVTFTVSSTRQVVKKPGTKDRVFPAAEVRDRFVLQRIDDRWRLDVWEVLT